MKMQLFEMFEKTIRRTDTKLVPVENILCTPIKIKFFTESLNHSSW